MSHTRHNNRMPYAFGGIQQPCLSFTTAVSAVLAMAALYALFSYIDDYGSPYLKRLTLLKTQTLNEAIRSTDPTASIRTVAETVDPETSQVFIAATDFNDTWIMSTVFHLDYYLYPNGPSRKVQLHSGEDINDRLDFLTSSGDIVLSHERYNVDPTLFSVTEETDYFVYRKQ